MKWSLNILRKNINKKYFFRKKVNLKNEVIIRDKDVIDLDLTEINGNLTANSEYYCLHYDVKTSIITPSSRSLKPVKFSIEFSLKELYTTEDQQQKIKKLFSDEEILLLKGKYLDITPSIIDNIITRIPLQILTDDEKNDLDFPQGNGWKVLSESEYYKNKQKIQQFGINDKLLKVLNLLKDENK